jgi:hypothetical protein
MEQYGSISALEAMQEYSIYRLASRIKDPKNRGHKIVTETKKSKNGGPYAVYRLAKEDN